MTIHGTLASTLYPGTTSTVSFTVDNPGNSKQQLGTIHLASIVACNTAFERHLPLGPRGHDLRVGRDRRY